MSGNSSVLVQFASKRMLFISDDAPFLKELTDESEIAKRIQSNGSLLIRWRGEGALALLAQVIPKSSDDVDKVREDTQQWRILQECSNNTNPNRYFFYKLVLESLRKQIERTVAEGAELPSFKSL